DQRHVEFLTGADLLIHDSQYTLAEYPAKRNWGHSPAERVVDFAVAAQVRHLVLFHHDPLRDDDALDELLEVCRRRANGALQLTAAVEGHVIELAENVAAGHPASRARPAADPAPAPTGSTILLVDDDPEILDLLTLTLEPDGYVV